MSSLVTEIKTLFEQMMSLIDGYLELILQEGKGLIDFVSYIFTKCIPVEFQGFILFLLILSIIGAYIKYIK